LRHRDFYFPCLVQLSAYYIKKLIVCESVKFGSFAKFGLCGNIERLCKCAKSVLAENKKHPKDWLKIIPLVE